MEKRVHIMPVNVRYLTININIIFCFVKVELLTTIKFQGPIQTPHLEGNQHKDEEHHLLALKDKDND